MAVCNFLTPPSQRPQHFAVAVNVIEAKNLAWQHSDSYVTVKVGREIRLTQTQRNTSRPFYNEFFTFDFFLPLDALLEKRLTMSVKLGSKKALLSQELLGNVRMDLGLVWVQKHHQFYHKWAPLTHPKRSSSQVQGYLKVDIIILEKGDFMRIPYYRDDTDDTQTNLLLPCPREPYDPLIGKYKIFIYSGSNFRSQPEITLTTNADVTYSGKIDLTVSFAGFKISTSSKLNAKKVDWNELFTFTEVYPPMYQVIKLSVRINGDEVCTRIIFMTDIWNCAARGFPPAFGPAYIHFYDSGRFYQGSVLMAIMGEKLDTGQLPGRMLTCVHKHRLSGFNEKENLTFTDFVAFGTIFEASMLRENLCPGKDLVFTMSMGSEGTSIIQSEDCYNVSPQMECVQVNEEFWKLRIGKFKPCLFLRSSWPDARYRFYVSNALEKMALLMRSGLSSARKQICFSHLALAHEQLNKMMKELDAMCKENVALPQGTCGATTADKTRMVAFKKILESIVKSISAFHWKSTLTEKFHKACSMLNLIEKLSKDPQETFPDIVLNLWKNKQIISNCRISAQDILQGDFDIRSGKSCGKIVTIFFKPLKNEGHMEINGKVDIFLWLGPAANIGRCLELLPDGGEDVSRFVELPHYIRYANPGVFECRAYIYQGQFDLRRLKMEHLSSSVRIIMGGESQRTQVARRSVTPLWDEMLVFHKIVRYRSCCYLKKHPPAVVIEILNITKGQERLVGVTTALPVVHLLTDGGESRMSPKMDWHNIYDGYNKRIGEILALFEYLQVAENAVAQEPKEPSSWAGGTENYSAFEEDLDSESTVDQKGKGRQKDIQDYDGVSPEDSQLELEIVRQPKSEMWSQIDKKIERSSGTCRRDSSSPNGGLGVESSESYLVIEFPPRPGCVKYKAHSPYQNVEAAEDMENEATNPSCSCKAGSNRNQGSERGGGGTIRAFSSEGTIGRWSTGTATIKRKSKMKRAEKYSRVDETSRLLNSDSSEEKLETPGVIRESLPSIFKDKTGGKIKHFSMTLFAQEPSVCNHYHNALKNEGIEESKMQAAINLKSALAELRLLRKSSALNWQYKNPQRTNSYSDSAEQCSAEESTSLEIEEYIVPRSFKSLSEKTAIGKEPAKNVRFNVIQHSDLAKGAQKLNRGNHKTTTGDATRNKGHTKRILGSNLAKLLGNGMAMKRASLQRSTQKSKKITVTCGIKRESGGKWNKIISSDDSKTGSLRLSTLWKKKKTGIGKKRSLLRRAVPFHKLKRFHSGGSVSVESLKSLLSNIEFQQMEKAGEGSEENLQFHLLNPEQVELIIGDTRWENTRSNGLMSGDNNYGLSLEWRLHEKSRKENHVLSLPLKMRMDDNKVVRIKALHTKDGFKQKGTPGKSVKFSSPVNVEGMKGDERCFQIRKLKDDSKALRLNAYELQNDGESDDSENGDVERFQTSLSVMQRLFLLSGSEKQADNLMNEFSFWRTGRAFDLEFNYIRDSWSCTRILDKNLKAGTDEIELSELNPKTLQTKDDPLKNVTYRNGKIKTFPAKLNDIQETSFGGVSKGTNHEASKLQNVKNVLKKPFRPLKAGSRYKKLEEAKKKPENRHAKDIPQKNVTKKSRETKKIPAKPTLNSEEIELSDFGPKTAHATEDFEQNVTKRSRETKKNPAKLTLNLEEIELSDFGPKTAHAIDDSEQNVIKRSEETKKIPAKRALNSEEIELSEFKPKALHAKNGPQLNVNNEKNNIKPPLSDHEKYKETSFGGIRKEPTPKKSKTKVRPKNIGSRYKKLKDFAMARFKKLRKEKKIDKGAGSSTKQPYKKILSTSSASSSENLTKDRQELEMKELNRKPGELSLQDKGKSKSKSQAIRTNGGIAPAKDKPETVNKISYFKPIKCSKQFLNRFRTSESNRKEVIELKENIVRPRKNPYSGVTKKLLAETALVSDDLNVDTSFADHLKGQESDAPSEPMARRASLGSTATLVQEESPNASDPLNAGEGGNLTAQHESESQDRRRSRISGDNSQNLDHPLSDFLDQIEKENLYYESAFLTSASSNDAISRSDAAALNEENVLRIPHGIRPIVQEFRLEILFWGLRNFRKKLSNPSVTVTIADQSIESKWIPNTRSFPNFDQASSKITIKLPIENLYLPAAIIRLYSRNFWGRKRIQGYHVILNLHDLKAHMIRLEDWNRERSANEILLKKNQPKQSDFQRATEGDTEEEVEQTEEGTEKTEVESVQTEAELENTEVEIEQLYHPLIVHKESVQRPVKPKSLNIHVYPKINTSVRCVYNLPKRIVLKICKLLRKMDEALQEFSLYYILRSAVLLLFFLIATILSFFSWMFVPCLRLFESAKGSEKELDSVSLETLLLSGSKGENVEDWWVKYYNSIETMGDKNKLWLKNRTNVFVCDCCQDLPTECRRIPRKNMVKAGLVIYNNELEKQPEFQEFQDVFKQYPLHKTGRSVDLDPRDKEIAILKGAISISPPVAQNHFVTIFGEDAALGFLRRYPSTKKQPMIVRVYIIRAYNLHTQDWELKADAYVNIRLGNRKVASNQQEFVPSDLQPIFGKCFEIEAKFPRDTALTVQLMDYDKYKSDDLIGETTVDLEARYYSRHRGHCGLAQTYHSSGSFEWRDTMKPTELLQDLCKRHQALGPTYYRSSVIINSKQFFVTRVESENPEDVKENLALSVLRRWHELPFIGCCLVPEHVETRSLYRPNKPGVVQGQLEMWIDIFPKKNGMALRPIVDIEPRKPIEMQLRVSILNTANCALKDEAIFSDKHSDLYVKGWLTGKDDAQTTDVHYYSLTGEGNFNWRFIFNFHWQSAEKMMCVFEEKMFRMEQRKAPPRLYLQVWDKDTILKDDFIGKLILDLLKLPKPASSYHNVSLKMLSQDAPTINLFTVRKVRGWWPLTDRNKKNKNRRTVTGMLEAELELLTMKEAKKSPAGLGHDEPNALPYPERPEIAWNYITGIFSVFHYVILPFVWRHKWKVLFFSLVYFVALFIYSFPGYAAKKFVGAR